MNIAKKLLKKFRHVSSIKRMESLENSDNLQPLKELGGAERIILKQVVQLIGSFSRFSGMTAAPALVCKHFVHAFFDGFRVQRHIRVDE